jgi:lipopolysaccharide biosynthesis protein
VAPGDAPLTAIHSVDAGPPVRLIAFYLPQFHPIAENDEWWGTGFTEWRNVARADPRFAGHDQPHIPADLGFYDLRLPETRWQQAQLARTHGIHGFCYYHYWFEGRRLLGRPFDEVLASGEPDLPFALCWANDPWSRRWDGREDELLIAQTYSDADDLAHIRWLLPALADPRAITVDGKPMFLVYRATHLPDAARTTDTWREEVARAGLPGIHLVAVETAWDLGWDATSVGFDARVLFQPQFAWLMTAPQAQAARLEVPGLPDLQVYDYATVARAIQDIAPAPYRRYESVFPGWDNTARRGDKAVVMHDADPAAYESWLAAAVDRALRQPSGQGLVFLNAWNEWAEGCHLEPDRRHGRAFLEATRRALTQAGDRSPVPAMAGAG